MAEQPPGFQFEDVPLDEARRMGRGPRMEPMLYETLRTKIQSLSTDATRIQRRPQSRPRGRRPQGTAKAVRIIKKPSAPPSPAVIGPSIDNLAQSATSSATVRDRY